MGKGKDKWKDCYKRLNSILKVWAQAASHSLRLITTGMGGCKRDEDQLNYQLLTLSYIPFPKGSSHVLDKTTFLVT